MKYLSIIASITIAMMLFACADSVDSGNDDTNGNGNGDDTQLPVAEAELVYFWFFDGDLDNNTELETIDTTFPSAESGAFIEFFSALEGYPNTNRDASMERRNRPTDLNYREEGNGNVDYSEAEGDMRAVQVRDPFLGPNGENYMVFHLPSEGFEDLVFSLASKDEDAAEGLIFDYSVASGDPEWITDGLSSDQINQELLTDEYQIFELDLSDVEAANDNPDLKVRVRFDVDDGEVNDGDRVTFNNVALDGVPLD